MNKGNGQKITRDVRIHKDFTMEIFINSTKVRYLPFGNKLINKKYYLDNIFLFISIVGTCNGFAVSRVKNTTNRTGEVIGTTINWESSSKTETRHKALCCALVLNAHETICKACSTIKVNTYYKTLRNFDDKENQCPTSGKRESYMIACEIKEKLSQERKEEEKWIEETDL